MLLAIDAGNTNIVFALFDGQVMKGAWRIATQPQRTSDEYAAILLTLWRDSGITPRDVSASIVGSVVPDANFNLIKLCKGFFGTTPLLVSAGMPSLGMRILLDRPDEVGADRIINSIGGLVKYTPPFILVDFGTATTFDVVNAEGDYIGGAISPGINLSLKALHMAAAKLPLVPAAPTRKVIGTNTVDAMQSGIYWGYVGLIEGMLSRIQAEVGGKALVVATGGLAPLFSEAVPAIGCVDQDLTMRGLLRIYEMNAGLSKTV